MAILVSEALADTPHVAADSLMMFFDSLRLNTDTLAGGTGTFRSDVMMPVAIILLTLGAFASLFFVRSK